MKALTSAPLLQDQVKFSCLRLCGRSLAGLELPYHMMDMIEPLGLLHICWISVFAHCPGTSVDDYRQRPIIQFSRHRPTFERFIHYPDLLDPIPSDILCTRLLVAMSRA